MKTFTKYLLALTFAISLIACSNAVEKVQANAETNINIEGMTCAEGCAKAIEGAISDMPGVANCKVNFKEQSAAIKFDSTQVSHADIIATIEQINNGQYKAKKEDKK